jgi:hypothetical protein
MAGFDTSRTRTNTSGGAVVTRLSATENTASRSRVASRITG